MISLASACSDGYYDSDLDSSCYTGITSPTALEGTTWTIAINTTTKKITWTKHNALSTDGLYYESFTSAASSYYKFTYLANGGVPIVINYDVPVGFMQVEGKYNPSHVTFSGYTISMMGYGSLWGQTIAETGFSSFTVTFTSVNSASSLCIGIDEAPTFNISEIEYGTTGHSICAGGNGLMYNLVNVGCLPCVPCHTSCSLCFGGTNAKCTGCKSGYFLEAYWPYNTCDTTCPPETIKDSTNNKCVACHSYCSACTGSLNTQCSVCNSGYWLQPSPSSTTCLPSCPTILYYPDNSTNTCTSKFFNNINQYLILIQLGCHPSCYSCRAGTDTDCTSCTGSLYLYEFKCISSTACASIPGFYPNSTTNICTRNCHFLLLVFNFLLN